MWKVSCISLLFLSLFLSGCWDSTELDESIMIVGVGVSKEDGEYKVVMEATAPSDVSPTEDSIKGESILLEAKGKTFLDTSRELIRIAKRRLFFTHTEVWIIHSELAAKEDMLLFLDILRREQMIRLNSYLFITDDPPKDIFSTDHIFSNILSEELVSGLEYSEYISSYPEVKAKDYFEMSLSPLRTAYLPTIKIIERGDKTLSQLTGSAILKKDKMVGALNSEESFGLLWINNEVQAGSITIEFDDTKSSFKLIRGNTDLNTNLVGNHLTVNINIKAEGTLADQNVEIESINKWTKGLSEKVNQHIKGDIKKALQKLQKDLKTDATHIGINTYRKQPDQFKKVKDQWDDIFSEATININVDTKILDKGLIESPGYHLNKPEKPLPYQLRKKR